MNFKVYKLTKISSTHTNLRTDITIGTLISEPSVGGRIIMAANGLVFGSRFITTTPILKIEGNRYFTANSEYQLEEVSNEVE